MYIESMTEQEVDECRPIIEAAGLDFDQIKWDLTQEPQQARVISGVAFQRMLKLANKARISQTGMKCNRPKFEIVPERNLEING